MVSRIPVSRDKSPFEDQTPSEILSRERLILTKTYSTSEADFFSVTDPLAWASNSANEGCLRTFRYIRWSAIQYRIVLQTNPFIYGYMAATTLPHDERRQYPSVAPASFIDYGWYSYDDCVIIDLTSMPETTITVPWLFASTWIDLEKWLPDDDADLYEITRMCALKLMYGNTCLSTSSTIPKTFSVSVFMKVINPEVACPISPGAFMRQHEAQMFSALGNLAAGAASSAAGYAAAEAAKAGASYLFGEGEIPEFVEEVMAPPAPSIVSNDPDQGEIPPSEVVPSVFGGMNYSSSRNVLGTGTMMVPRGVGSHNSLIDFLQKPSMVLMTSLVSASSATVTVPVFDGRNVYENKTLDPVCSRLRFLSQFFRFWRGSITYTIMIISSPMTTWRLKIALDYQQGTLVSISPGDTLQKIITVRGSTVHQVTVPYIATTPWQFIGNPTALEYRDQSPAITISEFSPASKSGDITPSLYILAFESANKDFVFCSQIEPSLDEAASLKKKIPLVHEAQMKVAMFRAVDQTQFGSCNPVKYPADGVSTFEAMAKRWSPRTTQALYNPAYTGVWLYNDPAVAVQSTIDFLCAIFYYARGQYKLKVSFDPPPEVVASGAMAVMKMQTQKPDSSSVSTGVNPTIKFSDGTHVISLGLTQVMECTVPYLATVEWWPTGNGFRTTGARYVRFAPLVYTEGATSVPTNFIAISAGRDFCYSLSLPPPWTKARWYDTPDYQPPPAQGTNTAPTPLSSRVRERR